MSHRFPFKCSMYCHGYMHCSVSRLQEGGKDICFCRQITFSCQQQGIIWVNGSTGPVYHCPQDLLSHEPIGLEYLVLSFGSKDEAFAMIWSLDCFTIIMTIFDWLRLFWMCHLLAYSYHMECILGSEMTARPIWGQGWLQYLFNITGPPLIFYFYGLGQIKYGSIDYFLIRIKDFYGFIYLDLGCIKIRKNP